MDGPITFDPEKDVANLAKHGVSLARAAELDFSRAIIRPDLRFDYGEPRWLAYVHLDDRVHVIAFTRRGGGVRVISLRKANAREVSRYGPR